MRGPPALKLPDKAFTAIVLVTVLVLFLEAWATLTLESRGLLRRHAKDLVVLAMSPVFVGLCWLLIRDERRFLKRLWYLRPLTFRIAIAACAIGLLLRLMMWAKNVAVVAFGLNANTGQIFPQSLAVGYDCQPASILGIGLIVWWIVVPVTEEFVYRGILMSSMIQKGPVVAIVVSSVIFALAHMPQSTLFAFIAGVLFGIQYWSTRTIWAPVITHATYDGVISIDRMCLVLRWQPAEADIPVVQVGTTSLLVAVCCAVVIVWLLFTTKGRAVIPPDPDPS